ncbi:MAG: diacylglycerol kinase family protein [Clostridia bacterium]|jgi:diacylglycerol kinase|nr:diacylglycerol kinase family protein [Clostridia bacterium]
MLKSFAFAISGLVAAIKGERNFRIHLVAAMLVTVLGFVFKLSLLEWAILSLTVFLVLVAELVNTAVEKAVDLAAGGRYHPLAKTAKDVAAGGVLLAAVNAVIVGIIIFGSKIWG